MSKKTTEIQTVECNIHVCGRGEGNGGNIFFLLVEPEGYPCYFMHLFTNNNKYALSMAKSTTVSDNATEPLEKALAKSIIRPLQRLIDSKPVGAGDNPPFQIFFPKENQHLTSSPP